MSYKYRTNCVNSTAEAITDMIYHRLHREITYRTMLKHCPDLLDFAERLGYERKSSQGLTLKNDWHVNYYKSVYKGRPCYYMDHSRIEYIWIKAKKEGGKFAASPDDITI